MTTADVDRKKIIGIILQIIGIPMALLATIMFIVDRDLVKLALAIIAFVLLITGAHLSGEALLQHADWE